MQINDVYLTSGVRTAVGDYGGSLKDQRPGDLAAQVVREAVSRAGIAPETVGHCAIGNVIHTEAQDMYISRVAALGGGLPHETPAVTVNRLCGSGLQAIVTASQQIQLGLCDTAVGGGVESMSRAGYVAEGARFGNRMGDAKMVDMMVAALNCPIELYHMGVTAENVAEKWGVTREDQDALALSSHQRAQNAIESGRFKDQILPLELKSRKGTTVFEQDEHVRFDASPEDMQKLRSVFKKDGTVTAGNASGINDGAAAVVLMSGKAVEASGVKPRAKLLKYAFAGVEPKFMGIGPVPAVRNLLENTDYSVGDIDVWEVNEAFAAQAIAVARDLGLPDDRLNPNGSGIALGHPIGATGAIITVKAISELERTGGRLAVVTMCIGGGQGIAALFERV
ncbi:MAG: beta-ketothiolase BktB [Gammaproteobacteria bacterium]|nr:beta-ketothiolase BktB [Gammaproteobacteria bacterium]MDE0280078.1 beta-ketothiolase BktB [Gammaproteobacteria bacterium]MXY66917.1 acetyl-CoA C-acyltransferase [Gammaproteobacteria bacterium]MYG65843.1 acetyl-CoA C-acyltransferase [Gammaproteobacteria bacterium]MYH90353.1 acetyl-CoA C-acyltransferase [Gammaproteobacteria bacterium]